MLAACAKLALEASINQSTKGRGRSVNDMCRYRTFTSEPKVGMQIHATVVEVLPT